MLTAMQAVENIRSGRLSKDSIWAVNTEQDYHESHTGDDAAEAEQLEADMHHTEDAL
jgi:hypothetical protein